MAGIEIPKAQDHNAQDPIANATLSELNEFRWTILMFGNLGKDALNRVVTINLQETTYFETITETPTLGDSERSKYYADLNSKLVHVTT